MGLPQFLRLFLCFPMGFIFDSPFLSLRGSICSLKLVLFPTLCFRKVYHGFWYVPDNVWQIKSEKFLKFHSWILVAPLFIKFKYRQWKPTTHMSTIVVRTRNQQFFVGQHLLGFRTFGVACYAHQSMEESHRWSQKSLVLECLSIQRIQTHLQTVICISEVID